MKLKLMMALALSALLVPMKTMAGDVTITVTNDEKCQRQEVVEVDADLVFQKLGLPKDGKFIVKNALGQEVGYQIIAVQTGKRKQIKCRYQYASRKTVIENPHQNIKFLYRIITI